MGGRPRKPTSQHQLDGTFRADRHGRRLDANATLPPIEKPRDLDGTAGAVWDSIVASLPDGVLTQADCQTLEGACRWWAEWRRWTAILEEADRPAQALPAMRAAAAAWRNYIAAAARLGLSPVDRGRLDLAGPQRDPSGELDRFTRGADRAAVLPFDRPGGVPRNH